MVIALSPMPAFGLNARISRENACNQAYLLVPTKSQLSSVSYSSLSIYFSN